VAASEHASLCHPANGHQHHDTGAGTAMLMRRPGGDGTGVQRSSRRYVIKPVV